LPPPGIEPRSPGRPVRSQTLYCLSYPGSRTGWYSQKKMSLVYVTLVMSMTFCAVLNVDASRLGTIVSHVNWWCGTTSLLYVTSYVIPLRNPTTQPRRTVVVVGSVLTCPAALFLIADRRANPVGRTFRMSCASNFLNVLGLPVVMARNSEEQELRNGKR
jgi:hypothetical protein